MAFTLEEITAGLQKPDETIWVKDMATLQAGPNYAVIVDYLTGQSKSLSGLQQDYSLWDWAALRNLINNPEEINSSDQLVLDVIYHPLVWPGQKNTFNRWLIQHLLKKPSEKMFKAFWQLLKQQGIKEAEFFDFLVCGIGEVQEHSDVINNTPVKTLLVKQIKEFSKLVLPSHGTDNWNQFYFELLEEANESFARTYSLYGMLAYSRNPATFFVQYKNGKYLPDIISFLTKSENIILNTFEAKFFSVNLLYEYDTEKFAGLTSTVSQLYLDFIIERNFPRERHLTSDQFPVRKRISAPNSTWAIHFLLKLRKQQGIATLDKWVQSNKYFEPFALSVIQHHLGDDSFKYIEHSIKRYDSWEANSFIMQAMGLFRTFADSTRYIPFLWSHINHKSKQVRGYVGRILSEKDADAESKAIALLDHKNSDTRVTAAKILSDMSSPSAQEAVTSVVNKETNDNVRDILLQVVMDTAPKNADEQFINTMIDAADKRGKLKKPVEEWLDEPALPALFYNSGQQLPANVVRFLLYRMSRVKDISADLEARHIIPHIDKEKAAPFALQLIRLFNDHNGKPEHKYLMVLAALLGNDEVADKIRLNINKWIDESRWKMAEYGVGALALQGSDKALRWVEWYSRKYKSKKANVGAAALAALENAAEQLGISTHELGDRIVPDFGFEGLFKHFTVDGNEFRAYIDKDFKIAFFNEDNKKLKSIPAAADSELKEEFKGIAKEVRDIVKSQSPRLEYYLIIQRRWPFEKWQQFFLQNPVMFIYAVRLLWGVYDDNGKLLNTFMCNEDTSLQDINQDEISPDESKSVGIVHPSQLSADQLQQWKQIFFDQSVEPIFPQLDRRFPDTQGIDLSSKIITKYENKQMKTGSIRSTLERYGWARGGVGDGGTVTSFNLYYPEKKLEAIMEVEGVSVVYGFSGDERLGRLYIRDITIANKSYYGRKETDADLVAPEAVPDIFVKEMLAAIEAIAPFEKTA